MEKAGKQQAQRRAVPGSTGKGAVGFKPPEPFSAVQRNPGESVNGITFAENQSVKDLSGGKVDLHESGAVVQNTSPADSRLQDVGARSMAAGGEALIGDSRDRGHEIWHLAQQEMGQVKPTTSVNGTAVNDDPKLEKEADDFGSKIMQAKAAPFARQFSGSVTQQKKKH